MAKLTPYQKDALSYRRHISLTANAGSGKTYVLSKRYVEIALNENIPLSKIVAITFTEKAAAELYRRISKELEHRIEIETDSQLLSKLEKIRRQLISANISTIHSFCINVLKEFSPEAGIDANFTPVDQRTSDELIEMSIEEYTNEKLKSGLDTDQLKYLIRIYGSKEMLERDLSGLISKRRNIFGPSFRLYELSDSDAAEMLGDQFEQKFNEYFSAEIRNAMENIDIINSAVIENEKPNSRTASVDNILKAYSYSKNAFDIISCLKELREILLTRDGRIYKQGYLKESMREGLEHTIESVEIFFNELKPFEIDPDYKIIQHELVRFGKSVYKVLSDIIGIYEQKKNERSFLDFEDLLLKTRDIIGSESVREILNKRFNYIMIDEYQDTNELQYSIVMPILEDLRKGNLFVVGDEKQSIYMFLDAELEVFGRTKSEIKKKAGEEAVLNLPHSFRVAPGIALFVNTLFKKLFAAPSAAFNEVEYSELVCAKEETSKGHVEFLLSDEKDINSSESILVAKRILKLKNEAENFSFGNIAVLCRKRSSFAEIEKSFIDYKIPYSIVGGRGFYQQQVIYDVHNYLSFLLNNKNDKALVGILRSPFFTIPDSEIFNIFLETGDSYFEKLKYYSGKYSRLENTVAALEKHIEYADNFSLGVTIDAVLKETGYYAVAASKTDGAQQIANIKKLIVIADDFSRQHFNTLYDFVDFLGDSIEGIEDEGQASVAVDENAVKIMTIHQAKGLEFDAVFLFGCNASVRESKVKTKNISFDKEYGFIAKVPVGGDYFNPYRSAPIVNLYNYKIKRKELAEHKRLLYVALTRAINYLFISASHDDFKFTGNSFIDLIAKGMDSDLNSTLLKISGELTMMKGEENNYDTYTKGLDLDIPITSTIDELEAPAGDAGLPDIDPSNIHITALKDNVKEEIISATKIAVYSQCPVKYELIYELGIPRLFQLVKKYSADFEFHPKEDEESKTGADVKGKIIHEVLEKEIPEEEVYESVFNLLQREIDITDANRSSLIFTAEVITAEVVKYYSSKVFNEIKLFENYRNEFEVYSREEDFYLYGIIDKLIIENERLIVIDYKTDSVTPEKISSKAQYYLPQLKFYSYLLTKLFPQTASVELRIIFIKHPDDYFKRIFSVDEIISFGKNIQKTVTDIRSSNFKPNLDHCPYCYFADNENKCIKLIGSES